MIFARKKATIIEFPINPHIDRCFGYMAMALGFDYWLLPQLSSHIYGSYTANSNNIAALLKLVSHVVSVRDINLV